MYRQGQISIHTLRVEGDCHGRKKHRSGCKISIHTLRVEGDCTITGSVPCDDIFQSTPSVWRVTVNTFFGDFQDFFISIHTLRVEGDGLIRYGMILTV